MFISKTEFTINKQSFMFTSHLTEAGLFMHYSCSFMQYLVNQERGMSQQCSANIFINLYMRHQKG